MRGLFVLGRISKKLLFYAYSKSGFELPSIYTYLGVLTDEEVYNTGLEGCHIHIVKGKNSFTDFYLYKKRQPLDTLLYFRNSIIITNSSNIIRYNTT